VSSTFPVTRWSVIAAVASGGDNAAARAALGELCRLYWMPLYAFARRKNLRPEDSEDATQGFLLGVLESQFLAGADPALGRLRSFLLTAFSRHLMDLHRDAGRLKRGGGIEFISLDFEDAESRYQAAPQSQDAALQFESDWAAAVLEAAIAQLEADYAASGRSDIFDGLRPFLGAGGEIPNQAELAARLGMSHAALRQSLLRLRDRFRATLRAQIADTLREPTEAAIDEELRALRAVLAG
jgi:DNA-directed RNA polymerase specialized sigma24 family protein